MIRNRAFQGSSINGSASTIRNTNFWHPVGNVNLSVDTFSPALSTSLPYHMRVDVPSDAHGTVGFYNEGFWGFYVDSRKQYNVSLYMRGDYRGNVECHFKNNITGHILGHTSVHVNQVNSDGWKHIVLPTFRPSQSPGNPNNTFHFTFDGAQLAGQSFYVNLLSVFKQTYKHRSNGLREDLAEALDGLGASWARLPGGNNMEGLAPPFYWKWNETIGPLTNRPGRPGTWGDIQTDGFGILEMMQMTTDMDLTTFLGVWAGLYLDGTVIPESDLSPYVDSVMDELDFLTVSPL